MATIRSAAVAVMLAVSLTGCAEKWEKPGGTQQEFDAMRSVCISRAYARFPVLHRPVQLSSGYTTPVTTNCTGFGYSVNCYQTGGQYVPPAVISIDDNEAARNQDVRACFYENGWQPAQQSQRAAPSIPTAAAPDVSPGGCVLDSGKAIVRLSSVLRCNKSHLDDTALAVGTPPLARSGRGCVLEDGAVVLPLSLLLYCNKDNFIIE